MKKNKMPLSATKRILPFIGNMNRNECGEK